MPGAVISSNKQVVCSNKLVICSNYFSDFKNTFEMGINFSFLKFNILFFWGFLGVWIVYDLHVLKKSSFVLKSYFDYFLKRFKESKE